MERSMDGIDLGAEAFSQGERLLLRTIRLLALRSACHGQQCHFELACGCYGEEAYRTLSVFVEQLRLNGQRRIVLSAPPARTVTDDERAILTAFAAAQNDDYRELDAQLADLTQAQPPASLGGAVCLVAQVFAMQGLVISSERRERVAA
jgi:hypothetical protein